MFHTEELLHLNLVVPTAEPKIEPEKETPILSKIRFGELAVGSKFIFNGIWLVKTGEYNAESDRKRGKNSYLFFKKDIVLGSVCNDELDTHDLKYNEAAFFHCPYMPGDEDKQVTPSTPGKKYGLFDEYEGLKYWADSNKKPPCQIIIIQDSKGNSVEVLQDDYKWVTQLSFDLAEPSWSVPIRLKECELLLAYRSGMLMLSYVDKKTGTANVVWSQAFDGWENSAMTPGIYKCTITINDMQLVEDY